MKTATAGADYARMAHAINWLCAHAHEQPALDRLAQEIGLSPWHCQRLFRRWAGISPRRFLAQLGVVAARERLQASASVLDAALDAGFSGPGRLHAQFVAIEAMTPGEARRQGAGSVIRHAVHDSPFGPLFLAHSERGICALSFPELEQCEEPAAELARRWPAARLVHDPAAGKALAARLFDEPAEDAPPLTLRLGGTNLQLQVWRALLRIPAGAVVSYGQLAAWLGRPTASRAVANAVGANPVAWLIPCHRVLRANGALGGYRWGSERKRLMLAREWSRD